MADFKSLKFNAKLKATKKPIYSSLEMLIYTESSYSVTPNSDWFSWIIASIEFTAMSEEHDHEIRDPTDIQLLYRANKAEWWIFTTQNSAEF